MRGFFLATLFRYVGLPLKRESCDEVTLFEGEAFFRSCFALGGLIAEQGRVHGGEVVGDQRGEAHVRENVALEVDSRRYFDQAQTFVVEFEHGALGDVEDFLPTLDGVFPAESEVFDPFDELADLAFADDSQCAVFTGDLQAAAGEGAEEIDFTGVLTDVDESAGACGAGAEAADVDVARAVGLGHAEKRLIEAAAVVEIELGRLIDDRRGIGHGAKVEPGRGDAANAAGLDGQGNAVN